MSGFGDTFVKMLLLVAMMIPGYLLVKSKLVKEGSLKSFSALLLYVGQPFLSLDSFIKIKYTPQIGINILYAFIFAVVLQVSLFLIMYFATFRFYDDHKTSRELLKDEKFDPLFIVEGSEEEKLYKLIKHGRGIRAMTLCTIFGNVGFFGVPVLKVLFSESDETIVYSTMFVLAMNIMAWTLGVFIITGEKKYISIRKAIFNPQTLTLIVALPLFLTNAKVPTPIGDAIKMLGDMTAPLCMIVLGLRFGFVKVKDFFSDYKIFITVFLKILAIPLIVYGIMYKIPMDRILKQTLVILSGMPTAVITLGFSELYGGDQKTTASIVLMSSVLASLTVPLIMFLTGLPGFAS